jgi:photosystem II stability/assembly factor-like uncharacterized protein
MLRKLNPSALDSVKARLKPIGAIIMFAVLSGIPVFPQTSRAPDAFSYIGWLVGTHGVIAHTDDAKKELGWALQSPPKKYKDTDFYAVFFVDEANGWVVGAQGVILHTTNGGKEWKEQTSGVATPLYSVWFRDADKGWAVGFPGVILNTTDGGKNWNPQVSGVTKALNGVTFTSDNDGFAVGETGTILLTANGGANWSPPKIPVGFQTFLTGVSFGSRTVGLGCRSWRHLQYHRCRAELVAVAEKRSFQRGPC